jgi:hypothetical protein
MDTFFNKYFNIRKKMSYTLGIRLDNCNLNNYFNNSNINLKKYLEMKFEDITENIGY